MRKRIIKLVACIVLLVLCIVAVANKEDLIMLLNNQLDNDTKAIMKQKLSYSEIKKISLLNEDISNFKEQIKLTNYYFNNQEIYDYFNSLAKIDNKIVVNKANIYASGNINLDMIKKFNEDETKKKEFINVLLNGANENVNAIMIVDPSNNEVVVNKNYYLGNYIPNDLVLVDDYIDKLDKEEYYLQKNTNDSLKNLCNDLEKEFDGKCGNMVLTSSYRSFVEQTKVYKEEISKSKDASIFVQTPGNSEHQLGNTFDFMLSGVTKTGFSGTEQYKWIEANKSKYGLILRYPKNKKDITGIAYESWHYRYVGPTLASQINSQNLTLEEFFHKEINK